MKACQQNTPTNILLILLGHSFAVLTKNDTNIETSESAEKMHIGMGIGASATNEAPAWKPLPKRLQIPKAVPQSAVGNTHGVAQ